MRTLKSLTLIFWLFVFASGIAYAFDTIDLVDPVKAQIEIKNVAGKTEMTLWDSNYGSRESYLRTANLDSKTKVVISGKEAKYTELTRFDGKYVEISGEIAYVYQDYKKWMEWRIVHIQPIPPGKTK